MAKIKIVSSTHMLNRKKRLQDYFDKPNQIATPNQRSLPKYKHLFDKPKRNKSNKKQNRPENRPKRLSQARLEPPRRERQSRPNRLNKSGQKYSRFEQSINREYDSPSKQHEEIDMLFKGAQKKMKGNSVVDNAIQKVNQHLKSNQLRQAIGSLNEALNTEPNNQDLIYLLGICHIFNSSYEEAIDIFQEMLQTKPKKNIYLLLSVCYKKVQRYRQTQEILQQCIRRFPKYYEAYIYRGKLYLKLKQFKQALKDFDKALNIDSKKQIAFVGKGDCLRLIENYEDAKRYYSDAYHSNPRNNVSLLLRRAICSMQLKQYDKAFQDIDRLLQTDQESSQALYFKGLILNKLSNNALKTEKQSQALICYQQSIKYNTNKRAVTRSIYEITKIKIQNRDYYQALFTLQRAQYLDIDEKVIKKFKMFINGVTSMMKKNYQDGVKILTELAEDQSKPLSNFLKPLFYSTRSYGYMALQRYQQARQDLQLMEAQFSLDLPNLYNKFICDGILACNNNKYQNALTLFSKASKALPHRIEPAFYKAVTLICFATKVLPKDLKDKKKQYLQSAMRTITKIQTIQNNPSLFMIKGLLQYALGDLDKALKDLDQCLAESTKPNPLVFYLVGLIFAQSGRYNQAISQFKRAIDNDQKHTIPQSYLSRAKCMLLTGQVNTGFVDLQSYMSYRPSSPQIHIWAGHLLFYIGAYEDAAKAYSNINNINKNFQVLLYRAKCYLTCKDVLNTLANLKLMLEIKQDTKINFDYQVLQSLRECSDQSISEYSAVRAHMKQAKSKAEGSFGLLFEQYDYQFYKGVTYFFDKKYAQASKNFKRALQIIDKQMVGSNHKDQQFYYQFRKFSFNNRSFNYFEIVYNIAVAEMMLGQLPRALKMLKGLYQALPDGQTKQDFGRFVALVQQQTRNPFNTIDNQQNDIEEAQFIPFIYENRLCSIFPQVVLPFKTPVRTRIFFCLPHVAKPDIVPRFQQKILEEFNMSSIEIKPEAPWIRRSDEGVIFTDQVVKLDIQLSQSSSSSESDQSESGQDEQGIEHQEGVFADHRHYNGNDLSQGYHQDEDQGSQQAEPAANTRMTANQLKQFFKLDRQVEQKLARRYN